MTPFDRAIRWLESRAGSRGYYPVAVDRGYPRFVAHIFRVRRADKPSLWFLVQDKKVRRICL